MAKSTTFSFAGFILAITSAYVSARFAYQLPADAELNLFAPVVNSFICDGLPYGYYADVDNNCQIFHVCMPLQDEQGTITQTAHFSFMCGNQTVFSQDSLTCTFPELAYPCGDSRAIYDSSNSDFGNIIFNKK